MSWWIPRPGGPGAPPSAGDEKGDVVLKDIPPLMERKGFEANQWTGYLTPEYMSLTGNWLTFLPLPEGAPSFIGTLLMAAFLKRLSETEKGHELIQKIIKEYLSTIGGVLEELHKSSVASPYIACMNSYVVVNIYKRLGLISPNDATQCRAWLDHFLGEMLLTERAGFSLSALTHLVQGGAKTGAALTAVLAPKP